MQLTNTYQALATRLQDSPEILRYFQENTKKYEKSILLVESLYNFDTSWSQHVKILESLIRVYYLFDKDKKQ